MSAPVRRNIDDLTPEDLAAYERAVDCLKRSGEYARLAAIHNHVSENPPSGCEHDSELFLPWHRGLLHHFEQALRATDAGPSARDLSIPYWDWTRLPRGGRRYPDPFMRTDSPLFQEVRVPDPPDPDVTPEQITEVVTLYPKWEEFAGLPKNSIPKGEGMMESPHHDYMHIGFIMGPMAIPSSAANDPIFWSFHAFVDRQWNRWQRIHGTPPGCQTCVLRGLPDTTVGDVLDVEALGYRYEFTPEELERPVDTSRSRVETVELGRGSGPVVLGGDVAAYATWCGFERRTEEVTRARLVAELQTTDSVILQAYVHPASVADGRQVSPEFSVGHFAVWASAGHHGHAHDEGFGVRSLPMTAPLRRILRSDVAETWCVSAQASFPLMAARDRRLNPVPPSTEPQVRIRALRLELLLA